MKTTIRSGFLGERGSMHALTGGLKLALEALSHQFQTRPCTRQKLYELRPQSSSTRGHLGTVLCMLCKLGGERWVRYIMITTLLNIYAVEIKFYTRSSGLPEKKWWPLYRVYRPFCPVNAASRGALIGFPWWSTGFYLAPPVFRVEHR